MPAGSWFLIDLLSCLPFDLLLTFNVFGDPSDPSVDFDPSVLRVVRMVRLIRLLKLARILRASRIFTRWESSISIPYTTRTLVQWTLIVVMMVHWFSCTWPIEATLHGTQRDNPPVGFTEALTQRMQTDPSCTGCVMDGPFAIEMRPYCLDECLTECEVDLIADFELQAHLLRKASRAQPTASDESVIRLRALAAAKAAAKSSGGGGGGGGDGGTSDSADKAAFINLVKASSSWICRASWAGEIDRYEPVSIYAHSLANSGMIGSPQNTAENILYFILFFIASIINATFIGTICGTIATGDPHTTEYKTKMDELNYFLDDVAAVRALPARIQSAIGPVKMCRRLAPRSFTPSPTCHFHPSLPPPPPLPLPALAPQTLPVYVARSCLSAAYFPPRACSGILHGDPGLAQEAILPHAVRAHEPRALWGRQGVPFQGGL